MKTLKTIQVLCRMGQILSKVVFILCTIGAAGCLFGILGVVTGDAILRVGGESMEKFFADRGISYGTVCASMTVGAILCAGEAVLARFAELYFRREQRAGTPFTHAGAKELLRLGILAIAIPLGAQMLAEIAHSVFTSLMPAVAPLSLDSSAPVAGGVAMLLMSLLCTYGATLREEAQTPAEPAEDTSSRN